MNPPDRQRVVVVAAQGPECDTRVLEEAIQINFDDRDEIPHDELMDRVLELVNPAPFVIEEKRSQIRWGADGALVQELLIQYAAGFTSGLTVAGILAGLQKLSRRPKETLTPPSSITADAAWHRFSRFLNSAFKVSSTRATEVADHDEEWRIRATGDGYRYEGTVSKDGRILGARRVEG